MSTAPLIDWDTGRTVLPAGVKTLVDVQPERVQSLWAGRLHRGKITALDGDPGVGKSTLAIDMAARVSTASPWPDRSHCPLGDVVILSAEDGLADTIRPRLDAAGGDPARVHVIQDVPVTDADGEVISWRPPHLGDIDRIERVLEATGALLLIVDVLMAYLPSGVDSHRDQDVRGVLHRLSALAERTGCCVLLLRHLNKAPGGNPLYRGGGSIGIVGAARVGLLAARDPDDESTVVLAPTKANLTVMPPALAYRLIEAGNGTARVDWLGAVDRSASDLLRSHDQGDGADHDELGGLLQQLLADNGGTVAAKTGLEYLKGSGFSQSAIERARKRTGVYARKQGMDTGWVWTTEEPGKNPKNPPLTEPGPSVSSAGSSVCADCGLDLDSALAAAGITGHPGCGDESTPLQWRRA